ncbi:hypothetical protein [Jiangella asiatica]|uniref:Uncharacterized protein n=1 Tax=Jiangella asiatica TaxID=2530372 RepID=A0A4R5CKE6_9ACTN|nr:hypothetical protein [Jiangella asiatica]TDE00336.1 hypothetical protein E1269_25795 [Jiangella asiatica]
MTTVRPGRPLGRLARLSIAAAGAAVVAILPSLLIAPAATAHPFGPPLNARVDVNANEVSVQWLAAEDDWVILGEHLDAFAAQTDADGGQLTGADLLARSDNLPSYLLSHISVSQRGEVCAGRVDQLDDLLAHGALLVFECPAEVTAVELSVTALTDVNENYRTVVTSEVPSEPGQSLFTAGTSTQMWRFDPDGGSSIATQSLVAAGALVVVAVGGGVVWWRRAASTPPAEVAR